MNFKLFEKPMVEAGDNLEVAKDKANAWSLEVEKKKTGVVPSSGKVDTRRSVRFVALNIVFIIQSPSSWADEET